MKLRFPLYAQIIFVFLCNMLMLYAIFLFSFCNHFNMGWESIVYGPVCDRVQFISMVIHRQMLGLPRSEWKNLLDEFSKFYGAKFYLFDSAGKQVEGESIEVPEQIKPKLHHPQLHFLGMKNEPTGDFHTEIHAASTEQISGPNLEVLAQGMPPPPSNMPMQIEGDTSFHSEEEPPPMPPGQGVTRINVANLSMPSPSEMLPEVADKSRNPKDKFQDKGPQTIFFMGPPGRFFLHTNSPNLTWIGAPMPVGSQQHAGLGTLVAVTPNIWQTKLVSDFGYIFMILIGLISLSLLVWWPFIYTTTSAINKLTSATEKIAEGKFDVALNLKRQDEIGRLCEAINAMSSRLNMFVTGQKRFLGDIAHELCSPIGRLQVATALLENTSTEEQAGLLNDIQDEADQMSALINELLAFSKAGVLGPDICLQETDLSAILQKVCSKAEFNESVVLDIGSSKLQCLGDEVLLERAISNILRNAKRYAADSGPINVQASKKEKKVLVKITDNGPGVPEETIELLGQPFYRPESSRNRGYGGVGLGLAIVKTCVEACNGTVSLKNRQPNGLEVNVNLVAFS